MSRMHHAHVNKALRAYTPRSDRFWRLPHEFDGKPMPIKRYPVQTRPVDNAGPEVQKRRKARITLPTVSIQGTR